MTTMTTRGSRTGRGLVLGGLGLVALVVLLVAPAFACSASGPNLTIFPTAGPPETPFNLDGKGYDPESPIVLRWNGQVVETVQPDEAGNFQHQMVAPANASPNYYQVQAVQVTTQGVRQLGFAVFKVEAAPVPPVAENPPAAEPLEPTKPVVPTDPAPAPAPAPAAAPKPVVNAPVRTPAPARPAATEPVTASPTAVAPGPVAAAPAAASLPATAPADPVAAAPTPMQAPLPELAIPDAADLWSGIEAKHVPSLVDVPSTTGSSGAPVGVALFAAGVVVLGSLAAAGGRRRLALARSARH